MNILVEKMLQKDSITNNGAITNSTSLSNCLDLFFLAGACRNEQVQNIEAKLESAYVEDRIKTLKIIFWAGDIRQGAGERRFFKLALNWLLKNHKEDLLSYIVYVPDFSRWDVLFDLATKDQDILNWLCNSIVNFNNTKYGSLLFKWLPRKKQYNNLAKFIRNKLNLSPKEYRKLLVDNTQVVEQKMCKKQWNEIEYSHVPSVAMHKYNNAWYRNDNERFNEYLKSVKDGKSKINASAIFPHDIIKNCIIYGYCGSKKLSDAEILQWENLPNYLNGKKNSILPVCDVSGSMYGLPMQICIALGLYISERNEGAFKDAFITFSQNPKMNYLKGDINSRLKQLSNADWGMNTDLEAVFRVLLNKAVENNLTQEELPETLLIMSDMEFDTACSNNNKNNFEVAKQMYESYGYKLPKIVFWNLNGRVGNVPISVNDRGVALVSGASPSILKSVLSKDINPIEIMNNVIEVERYNFIK